MNKWFRKGNSRRFYRIDMPVRYFIVPSSPIKDREIYATGVNYFPQTFLNKVEEQKFQVRHWTKRVQEHTVTITQIVEEMLNYIDFFGDCSRTISEGRNPRNNLDYWMRINDHLQGFKSLKKLEHSSPKTFQYLQMIEEKYLAYLQRMATSLEKSTPQHFYVEGRLPEGFKLDETLKVLQQAKFEKIPLVQTILYIASYLNSYLGAYRQIHDDNFLKQFPKLWPVKMANLSASGVAIHVEKQFPQYSQVDVLFYFPEDEKVIQFDGSIVDIRIDEKTQTERVAINFEFPDGKHQDYLQIQIQKQEVKQCMDLVF
ncbi:MAG: PilZ domain-containing protein [Gammaproteobacteria bacterium]|nr:PilZ domain-containing protein [Gammaproteobacteria bacterium]MBD3776967.1 PilZ domain-containing protein [Thiotrichales bacterium]